MAKMTKKEMFEQVIALAKGEEVVVTPEEMEAFATHEIELLSRKSASGSGKLTKAQKENEGYKVAILALLGESDRPLTISEMMEDERLAGLKNQRVSAIVTLLKKAGLVVRTEDKKKAYFSLAGEVATEEVGV